VLTVVGLGPAGPEHLSAATWEAVDSSDVVWLRTAVHPSAAAVLARRPDARKFDEAYERAERFEEVYEAIVTDLLEASSSRASVCYAVPGSPLVAERTVELLRERLAPDELVVVPALSFLDLAWLRLGLDPVAAGVRLADAATAVVDLAAVAPGGSVLVAQAWSRSVLSDLKLALEDPAPGQRAVLLHHLGLPDEQVVEVDWAELDRTLEPDHLTSVFVPALAVPPGQAVTELAETVALLRELCPWDREQTHRSLLRHLLEETYETIEALEGLGDDPASAAPEAVAHAEEELGDLLCQVVFHSTLAAEEGLFTLSDVAASLSEKLIARHPHVFSTAHAETADDVVQSWERSKDRSKQREHLLDGIPAAMPALARAEKAERKLRSVGLGWERSGETATALSARLGAVLGGGEAETEAGDLLLLLARFLADRRIDPETALRRAIDRLATQVVRLEEEARRAGTDLAGFAAVHEPHVPLC
jgi:tetrapyrrole methylase family protein/MazG family protein